MSSVMVSSRSFTSGAEIASATAQSLHFALVSTDELVASAASTFSVPPDKLRDALLRPPSLLGMSDRVRRHLARLFVAVCTARLDADEVVLHVPYAASVAPGISHILRVRLTATAERRAHAAAEALRISVEKATRHITTDDRHADAISSIVFGKPDADDAYDLVLDTTGRSEADCAEQIARTVQDRRYLPSSYSKRCASELAAAAAIEATLAARDIDSAVTVHEGHATVRAEAPAGKRAELAAAADKAAALSPSITKVDFLWVDDLFDTYAASMR